MKHLFFINSNITYLSARAVIAHLKLKKSNCVFIYERITPHNDDHQWINLPFEWSSNYCHPKLNFLRFNKQKKQLEMLLAKIARGQLFHIYLPHAKFAFVPVIQNIPENRGHSFIDEGTLNWYIKSTRLADQTYRRLINNRQTSSLVTGIIGVYLRAIYSKIYKNGYLIKRAYFTTNYEAAYALTDLSFQNFSRRIDTPVINLPISNSSFLPSRSITFIGTPMLERNLLTSDEVKTDICRYLEKYKPNKVLIKFHPTQFDYRLRQFYLAIFNDYEIETEIIPDHYILELDLLAGTDIELFGYQSTLINLAKHLGITAHEIGKERPKIS